MTSERPGQIITFYSYKGGTGRTMALANVAYMLAKDSGNKGVLMVDWDLEAPGLHRYFGDLLHTRFPGDHRGRQLDAWPGLIDYFLAVHRLAGSEAGAT